MGEMAILCYALPVVAYVEKNKRDLTLKLEEYSIDQINMTE